MHRIMYNLLWIFGLFQLIFGEESEKYTQNKELLPNGVLTLYWTVAYGRFYFKTVTGRGDNVVLAYSYNDVPIDGFIAGYDESATKFINDLHIDFAGLYLNIQLIWHLI